MKKLGLLVMPLMAISLLASCNNGGGDKPEQIEFMLSSDRMIEVEGNIATVYVNWKQTDHIIKFNSFTFTSDPVKENETSFDQTDDPRPMPVKITFNDYIMEDINGTLSFTYEDATAMTTGSSSIEIAIYGLRSMLPVKNSLYYCSEGITQLVANEVYEYDDKGLLTKSVKRYVQGDISETHEYNYDDKNNVTKDRYIVVEDGETKKDTTTLYTYVYDDKSRIKEKKTQDTSVTNYKIEKYTYEFDSKDWSTYKYISSDDVVYKDITRTFQDDLYVKSVDSKNDEYYYYTWDEYKCNTKIETYSGEEKIPTNHKSDEIYEYHKNAPDKITKYVLSYYEEGELESTETILTEYDEHDRKIKISDYDEEILNSYLVYEYAN